MTIQPLPNRRLVASRLLGILACAVFGLGPVPAIAQDTDTEFSEAELETAKERRQEEITEIKDLIRSLEKKRKAASKETSKFQMGGPPGPGQAAAAAAAEPADDVYVSRRRKANQADSQPVAPRSGVGAFGPGGPQGGAGLFPGPGGLFGAPPGLINRQTKGRGAPAAPKYESPLTQFLDARIRDAKEDLALVGKMKPSEYAAEIRAEQKAAQTAEAYRRIRRESEQELIEEMAAKQAEAKEREENAIRLSGNCPVRPIFATFAHLDAEQTPIAFPGTFGRSTAIYFQVANRTESRVIAWEFGYELLDGFDEVIAEGTSKHPAIDPLKEQDLFIAIRQVTEAVQLKIFVTRAKLENGTLWERLPEHQMTGLLVQRLDGAEFVNRRPQ
jgi:hypothetical protein